MKLVIVNGRIGSGKGEVARIIAEYLQFRIVNISDIVKKVTNFQTREDLQSTYSLKEKDRWWLVNAVLEEIGSDSVILVGFRELFVQKEIFARYSPSNYYIIHLLCPTNVRRKRVQERDNISKIEFIESEERENRLGIDEVMSNPSDFIIETNLPLYQVRLRCKEILEWIALSWIYEEMLGTTIFKHMFRNW